jgi:hypothetical protein
VAGQVAQEEEAALGMLVVHQEAKGVSDFRAGLRPFL